MNSVVEELGSRDLMETDYNIGRMWFSEFLLQPRFPAADKGPLSGAVYPTPLDKTEKELQASCLDESPLELEMPLTLECFLVPALLSLRTWVGAG